MRSLFLKIFLWFWLANAILVAVLVAANVWVLSPGGPPGRQAVLQIVSKSMSLAGRLAVESFDRGGRAALDEFLSKTKTDTGIPMNLLGADGRPLGSAPVTSGAHPSIEEAIRTGNAGVERTESAAFVTQPFQATDGRSFLMLGELPTPFGGGNVWRALVLLLLAAVLTAGGVCYALARHLTAPVRRLQTATWRLADGQLDVRVRKAGGGRHDELGDLERDFDYMAERIATLLKTQRRLLWDISHELRSPLARVSVAVGLARRNEGSERESAIDQIERDTGRLNDLITRLLALARLESGIDNGPPQTVDMGQLVRDIAADAQFEATSRGCRVCVVECESCNATASPDVLRSAVENVVRNAVVYTAPNTDVVLRFSRTNSSSGPVGVLEVRDHGPGVPDHELSDIFRPFHRSTDGRRRNVSTGLGLSIAERAIRSHGGSIRAANAPGGSLLVEIRLPVDATPAT